jgi:hypothetical protein
MDFPQHRHAPPAPRPGRKTLGNLRGRLGFFHFAEVLDLPQRDVKTETNRVIGLEGHTSIVSGKRRKFGCASSGAANSSGFSQRLFDLIRQLQAGNVLFDGRNPRAPQDDLFEFHVDKPITGIIIETAKIIQIPLLTLL